ncbi:MAG: hypothetical protein M1828_002295 [Chrysothrix sp. TS-e1954]|nr:MAG: hypothetical protein M1828_002295 [Chrysothrix sp. TS-e1954]
MTDGVVSVEQLSQDQGEGRPRESLFGGSSKKDQAVRQTEQLVTPYLNDRSGEETTSNDELSHYGEDDTWAQHAEREGLAHDSDSDEDASSRARFNGDAAKYKRLIRHERFLLEGLEAAENDDLAAHLYEAHLIKRENYKEAETQRESPGNEVSEQETDQGDQVYRSKQQWRLPDSWQPSQFWTAWPLPPEKVPAENERWMKAKDYDHDGETMIRRTGPDKPSQELEELIFAEMTSYSRRKFEVWQIGLEQQRAAKSQGRMRNLELDGVMDTVEVGEEQAVDFGGPHISTGGHTEQATLSAPHNANSPDSSNDHDSDREASPVLPSDDSRAHRLMQPSIRTILQHTDDLFIGLHRTRQNQNQQSSSESDSAEDSASEASGGQTHPPRARKRKRSHSTHRGRLRETSLAPVQHKRRRFESGDWSELLGTALLTGWDSRVVKRAAARCSKLFGEDMYLQTLPETVHTYEQVHPDLDKGLTSAEEDETAEERHLDSGWLCAKQDCVRHTQPFEDRANCIRHMHKRPGHAKNRAPIFLLVQKAHDLKCPIPPCKHIKSFESQREVAEHMEIVHPQVKHVLAGSERHAMIPATRRRQSATPAPRSRSRTPAKRGRSGTPGPQIARSRTPASAADSEISSSDASEELHGGVHVDGFLKPIKKRRGWRDSSGSRGTSPSGEGSRSLSKSSSALGDEDNDTLSIQQSSQKSSSSPSATAEENDDSPRNIINSQGSSRSQSPSEDHDDDSTSVTNSSDNPMANN